MTLGRSFMCQSFESRLFSYYEFHIFSSQPCRNCVTALMRRKSFRIHLPWPFLDLSVSCVV